MEIFLQACCSIFLEIREVNTPQTYKLCLEEGLSKNLRNVLQKRALICYVLYMLLHRQIKLVPNLSRLNFGTAKKYWIERGILSHSKEAIPKIVRKISVIGEIGYKSMEDYILGPASMGSGEAFLASPLDPFFAVTPAVLPWSCH